MNIEQMISVILQQKLFLVGVLLVLGFGFASRVFRSPFSLYQRRNCLLTKTEVRSYKKLKPVVHGLGLELMAQVRIADVISVKGRQNRRWWDAFKKISSKHVDFVVVKPSSGFQIICAIEIDDESHLEKSRVVRDKYINKAFKSAGLPLLRCKPGFEHTLTKEINQCVV